MRGALVSTHPSIAGDLSGSVPVGTAVCQPVRQLGDVSMYMCQRSSSRTGVAYRDTIVETDDTNNNTNTNKHPINVLVLLFLRILFASLYCSGGDGH